MKKLLIILLGSVLLASGCISSGITSSRKTKGEVSSLYQNQIN